MLVALQRTGDERARPAAAEHLVGLLRSWGRGPDHLTGLALAGIALPSRLGPRFVDALVFTRTGVVVIAAHEPGPDPGSGERAGAAVAAAKGALAGHEGGQYVTGLVAVVPGPEPQWHEPASVPGVAVVLADPRSLRRIIAQHNRWRTVWSADDVLDACYALSLAHLAPPRAALVADGFPARLPPVRSRLPELPAVVPVPAEPPPEAEEPGEPVAPLPRRPGSAVFPRPRPIRQVPWGLLTVLVLLVTAGVIAAVFVAQVFHGS
ncbi:hypothetical protein [Amycolatopsis sp. cg9]|uniref:hypothetical protein n=1 Tax=Amycolatopsis sp. cg9 TaxID=3238801 RepID=UPI003523864E